MCVYSVHSVCSVYMYVHVYVSSMVCIEYGVCVCVYVHGTCVSASLIVSDLFILNLYAHVHTHITT